MAADPRTSDKHRMLAANTIGHAQEILTPYGFRRVIYADWNASGRPLEDVERYIRDVVSPFYANSHSASSPLGSQSSAWVEEARRIVARSVNAHPRRDAVIFTGAGATSALNALAWLIRERYLARSSRSIVVTSRMEHHSNMLPWRHLGPPYRVLMIPVSRSTGTIDLDRLADVLRADGNDVVAAAFSMASNVTGVVQPFLKITSMCHAHGVPVFWDGSSAVPVVSVDMNTAAETAEARAAIAIDAIAFSGHKLLGGVDTPGVLVIKKALLRPSDDAGRDSTPLRPGGGTVTFVDAETQDYARKLEVREEGGSPNILGCVRLGLAFLVRGGPSEATERVHAIRGHVQRALRAWRKNPWIEVLGPDLLNGDDHVHQGALSLIIRHPSGRLLHHNFVCRVLSDLFGVQTRGGCLCAAPYVHDLLDISAATVARIRSKVTTAKRSPKALELLRPGVVRICFHYTTLPEETDVIIAAVNWIAKSGHRLLRRDYVFDVFEGGYRHRREKTNPIQVGGAWINNVRVRMHGASPMRYDLDEANPKGDILDWPAPLQSVDGDRAPPFSCASLIAEADEALEKVIRGVRRSARATDPLDFVGEPIVFEDSEAEDLRWFVGPEADSIAKEGFVCPVIGSQHGFIGDDQMSLVRLVNPISSVNPVNSMNSVNPISSISPISPINPMNSINPINPISSISPVNPINPMNPISSISPVNPMNPMNHIMARERKHELAGPSTCQNVPQLNGSRILRRFYECEPSARNGSLKEDDHIDDTLKEDDHIDDTLKDDHVNDTLKDDPVNASLRDDRADDPFQNNACDADNPFACENVEEPNEASAPPEPRHISPDNLIRLLGPSPPPVFPKAMLQAMRSTPLFRAMVSAVMDFKMLRPGDRVLVGLSGGKDSLSLLHLLLVAQRVLGLGICVGAATVDPMSPEYDPRPLQEFVPALGAPYFVVQAPIMAEGRRIHPRSICSYCSRMKRGILHSVAESERYNVLALAHHLDDLAESFFMMALHNGAIGTIKAVSTVREGRLRVIRPFVYARESETKNFARSFNLPVIPENCPACFSAPKERARIKAMLKAQEAIHPAIFGSIKKALKGIMS